MSGIPALKIVLLMLLAETLSAAALFGMTFPVDIPG